MDESGHVRYLGKSSGYYLLQNSRTYQNGAFHFSGYGHKYSTHHKLSAPNPLELPPPDLSDHLIAVYFKYFYPFLPLFYKKKLASCMKPSGDPVSPLLLNAIYAVASRISPDERVRSDPASADTAGDIFFERAKRLLDDYYDTPDISTVQALLLLASHQQGAMKSARAWIYSGMAFRMAQDLGLHRNCEHWNIPPEERERRKRVFWCCFIVDRLTSAIYGRSSTFEERDCDVPFPSVDDDEPIAIDQDTSASSRPPVSTIETLIHLVKICDILGHVLKNIYYAKARHHGPPQHIDQVLTTLNRQLSTWYQSLPISLQYKPPNTQNGETGRDPPLPICQMHMIYYTTIILLHRPFIPGPAHTTVSPISLPSYQLCLSAAESILDIVNIMLGENHLKYVLNYAVYYVFTAGIIFIKTAASSDAEKAFDAKVNINKIMHALDEIEVTWTTAARSCNILGELAGLRDINLECGNHATRANNKAAQPPPPSIAVPNSPEMSQQARKLTAPLDVKLGSEAYAGSPSWHAAPMSPTSPRPMHDNQMYPSSQLLSESYRLSPFLSRSSNARSTVIPGLERVYHRHPNLAAGVDSKLTVDPFAAPGTIVAHGQHRQFDPLGTAFWGVPSSLDADEWSQYFGAQGAFAQQQQQHQQPTPQLPPNTVSQPALIPSNEFIAPMEPLRAPYIQTSSLPLSSQPQSAPATQTYFSRSEYTKELIHTDDSVDVLSGVSMPINLPESPSRSVLLGFLGNQQTGFEKDAATNRKGAPESSELMYW
ncbi:fungal-specific transcription factor domain-containing protein [Radiomyces spectabilis]|uniref:fungal-specific transcription factor domain-containing protein n=1 Tax=Radiomyces spectabilis TaxID=64574 RepID=UPI00222019AA|nr:fungal-specific transcription factor domain-containing protein [Radiomyces spectabilis]KAI8370385.1 fungal-specific transcription factor domain-containing protein [Radiomyces spectabilis]